MGRVAGWPEPHQTLPAPVPLLPEQRKRVVLVVMKNKLQSPTWGQMKHKETNVTRL